MTNVKRLSAAVLIAATLPLAAASPALAAGLGPCTPAAGVAVGATGPAMNGGQLMAGVGQCRRIGSGEPYAYWSPGYSYGYTGTYGYAAPGYEGPAYMTDY